MTPYERVLHRLEQQGRPIRRGYGNSVMASCPCSTHRGDDSNPSLKVTEIVQGGEPSVVMFCHGGGTQDDVLVGLGFSPGPRGWAEVHGRTERGETEPRPVVVRAPTITEPTPDPLPSDAEWAALRRELDGRMNGKPHPTKQWRKTTLAALGCGFDPSSGRLVIPIRDEAGDVVNVVRYSTDGKPKALATRGRKRNLFPRPEDVPGSLLFVVEGETDAITLSQIGLAGVGIPGAASFKPEYVARLVAGRTDVVVLTDADDNGRAHAARVAQALADAAGDVTVRLLDLTPDRTDGYDVGDFYAELCRDGQGEHAQALLAGMALDAPVMPPKGREEVVSEALPPIATDVLLGWIVEFIRRYVILPEHAAEAVALWTLHTYAFDAAETTPYIAVLAPEKQAGKTRMLEVCEHLVSNPLMAADISPAALYRIIDRERPTILFDEGDATWNGQKEAVEAIRGTLNSGYRSSGASVRCIGKGADLNVQKFSTFSPKMLAGIDSNWPETVLDRSIQIHMQRKKAGEKVASLYYREAAEEAEPIRDACRVWAEANVEVLGRARPEMPASLSDRAGECWQPLYAIAQLAGPEWAEAADKAAHALSGSATAELSLGAKLLLAIRDAFADGGNPSFLPTQDLVAGINANEAYPFGGFKGGDGITPRYLQVTLKQYGVDAKGRETVDGDKKHGYYLDPFHDAWARWVPGHDDDSAATRSAESPVNTGDSEPLDRVDRVDRVIREGEGLPVSEGEDALDTLRLALEAEEGKTLKAEVGA